MIDRLHVLLDALGYELAAPELLDVLWLARVTGRELSAAEPRPGPATVRPSDPSVLEPVGDPGPEPAGAAPGASPSRRVQERAAEPAGRPHHLYASDGGGAPEGSGIRARFVRAPGPRALPGKQPLARALRPLRGHRDHRYRTVADIEATVQLTAESGVLDVVDRPEQELRYTAVLLVDDSSSMRLWQPLAREVKRLLEQAGVFRAVRMRRFIPGGDHRHTGTPRTESPVTFVLTDGVDEAWQSPAAARSIEAWGRGGPLAVLPPLPRRLWRGTAFDAQPHPVVAEQPFATVRELRVLDPLTALPVGPTDNRPAVPVVALTPSSLSAWARLLTRPGTPSLVDIALVGEAPRTSGSHPATLPQHRLERFRASFSPDAYRLAVRLSAIRPLSLPVIQLVRIASLPGTSPTAVAEVLLGDLLRPLEDGGPGDIRLPAAAGGRAADPLYDFRPGVRELLASGLSVEQSIEVVEAVGEALQPYLGRMPDFAALLDDPDGNERRSKETSAFAVLVSPVLDRLFGRTTPIAEVPDAPPAPLRFTVFGPHLAWRGDEPVTMGTPQQRAVMAVLLLHGGREVDDTALVKAVWGEQERGGRRRTARSAISRLRRALASSDVGIYELQSGFRLAARGGRDVPDLDLTAAERLHEEAKTARAAGDLAGARRALTEALARTEGDPLDGIPGPFAAAEASRLAEWRLALLEFRIELDLEAGDRRSVVPELTDLTRAHPLNERLRAHLMLALYRAGRPAEALAVYADVRRLLSEELGLDPGQDLKRLHQRILSGDDPGRHAVAPRPLSGQAAPPVTAPPVDGFRFTVLGPVRAWRGSELLSSGSPQQRALLAALLLRDGRTATAGELIDALWGEDPPSQAPAAIRTYASRLRKILGQDTLVSESGGYAIRTDRSALDLTLAQDLAAEAERARAAGDHVLARSLLDKVLGLWDGEALASVPGPYADNQRTRLEEWRLQLTETRLDLVLEAGLHVEAVSELTALTATHPLRERLRELLMVALYRSGRQAEALAVYADVRRLLAEELGVDPRPELAHLQQRILRADEDLGRPADTPNAPRRPAIPLQLPASVPDFTGRQDELREVTERLIRARGSVTVISGLGGVGKTTFAVHAAHTVRNHFPDGQLYVDLQGTRTRAPAAEAVLGAFLRALGTADSAIPDTLDERAALYRSMLENRRVLVFLDNARDADQLRPLLPCSAGCAVLVTTRVRMTASADARLVTLGVLSAEEALRLFTRIVGEERVRAEHGVALDVVGLCGFLPLAIRVAAARLAARRTWTVSVLAGKLADERRRLDELQAGDFAVRASFELGYGDLEPAQARAFRLLCLADGPDITQAAAGALLDLEPYWAEELLEELVGASLLESTAPGRYRYHDLVHLYARECAERGEQPASERRAALSRLLDFYLATAAGVYALEHPGDRLVEHLEPTEHERPAFDDRPSAIDWLYSEAANLLASVRQSAVPSLRCAVDTLWVTQDLAESGALSRQYEAVAMALWEEAARQSDPRAEGRAALVVARTHMSAGRFAQADDAAAHALAKAQSCGDALTACWAQTSRGTVALYLDRNEEAERHSTAALAGFRAVGDRPGEAGVLCSLSRARLATGEVSSALLLAEQGTAAYDALDMPLRGATARYTLGLALTAAQRFDEAIASFREALLRFTDSRQRLWEGMSLFRIAEAELAANRPARALDLAEQALAALDGIGGAWRRGNTLTVLGRALRAVGQNDRARACWQEALGIFEELGSPEARQVRELIEGRVASSAPNTA